MIIATKIKNVQIAVRDHRLPGAHARSLAGYANGYCTYHTNGIYTNSKYTQFCRVSQSDSNPKLSAFCNRLVSAKC